MTESLINEIMIENHRIMRQQILTELSEEFYLGLSRKFHPTVVEDIKNIFEEAKDRV